MMIPLTPHDGISTEKPCILAANPIKLEGDGVSKEVTADREHDVFAQIG